MIVTGIDPGYATFGQCVISRTAPHEPWRLVWLKSLKTSPKARFDARCRYVWEHRYQSGIIDLYAVEEQTGAQEGKRSKKRTSAEATRVQQIVGMLRVAAIHSDAAFVEPSPQEKNRVVAGMRGTAAPAQIERAVRALIRGIPDRKLTPHEVHALAVALAGARRHTQRD